MRAVTRKACGVAIALLIVFVAGCQAAPTVTPTPTATPKPVPFSLGVIPGQIEDSVPGQRCVFLVAVAQEGEGSGKGEVVSISANAESEWWRENTTVTVNPPAIAPGQVAEVTVIPTEKITLDTVMIRISGERDGLKETQTVTIKARAQEPQPDLEGLAVTAAEMRDSFIPWLSANHPELGITDETEWVPTVVRPHIVVVMYYLFFSEDWEMGLRWHVMIPPHDWAEIYLRHRATEVRPSYAFKISSLEAEAEPQAVDPEELVWR